MYVEQHGGRLAAPQRGVQLPFHLAQAVRARDVTYFDDLVSPIGSVALHIQGPLQVRGEVSDPAAF
ncbi:hypothetical protein GCM10023220_49240 [Streptomyces ziwulingensis]|uniref:Uncharacterized protein n=1 Tax=Streptomyces ziwulingensis TaxID=1045501 RepID=A0ABP9CM04_9ACTN